MESLTRGTPTELVSYVMGVAAKSNVEKRQVGCVITLDGKVVAEGFNVAGPTDEHGNDTTNLGIHAEAAACEHMRAEALTIQEGFGYEAHVTHPPCPECARMLREYGITKVNIVEAFMKFDSDKVRFDLVSGMFALKCFKDKECWNFDRTASAMKEALWLYEAELSPIDVVVALHCGFYKDFYHMEEALAKVLTFGASKYKPNNWRQCTDTGRYLAAAHRHLNAVIQGEDLDPETGLHHVDHVMCNLMFLSELGLK